MQNPEYNVLVIGSGGREHALAWKLSLSDRVKKVFVAPGNAGTASEKKIENVAIDPNQFDSLSQFALDNHIELTVIGPEAPLVDGIVDHFREKNLRCFGPTAAAAQLEGSKAFSKDFLSRHSIPTAAYETFEEPDAAIAYIRKMGAPIVVKADGLAAGKGVIVATTVNEAEAAVHSMLEGNQFGRAGHRVVIEEYLAGQEASFIVITDGQNVLPMATSQDHKRVGDGDTGLNTGGMGAYSPAPVVTQEVHERIMQQVILPTVRGMASEGNNYLGFLYAGLMISEQGEPKVIEFNCRFGDPETQPIMMRLESDLAELCNATLDNALDTAQADWSNESAMGVVLAAEGYPGTYQKGLEISGLELDFSDNCKIFHAGTKIEVKNDNEKFYTSGGRVLCVTALGQSIAEARENAYHNIAKISWPGMQYRNDIGHRAINGD